MCERESESEKTNAHLRLQSTQRDNGSGSTSERRGGRGRDTKKGDCTKYLCHELLQMPVYISAETVYVPSLLNPYLCPHLSS